jgi:hypothetical protein
MASQRIKATTAIGRARTKVKGINADFLTLWPRAEAVPVGWSATRTSAQTALWEASPLLCWIDRSEGDRFRRSARPAASPRQQSPDAMRPRSVGESVAHADGPQGPAGPSDVRSPGSIGRRARGHSSRSRARFAQSPGRR